VSTFLYRHAHQIKAIDIAALNLEPALEVQNPVGWHHDFRRGQITGIRASAFGARPGTIRRNVSRARTDVVVLGVGLAAIPRRVTAGEREWHCPMRVITCAGRHIALSGSFVDQGGPKSAAVPEAGDPPARCRLETLGAIASEGHRTSLHLDGTAAATGA